MDETPSFPESVSYRQLASWLKQAPPECGAQPEEPASPEEQNFDALLARWRQSGIELLAALKQGGPAISEGRSPRQLMALGALQAHLAMALQAGAASGRPPE